MPKNNLMMREREKKKESAGEKNRELNIIFMFFFGFLNYLN